jgi:hypothetical protein
MIRKYCLRPIGMYYRKSCPASIPEILRRMNDRRNIQVVEPTHAGQGLGKDRPLELELSPNRGVL